MAFLRSEYCYHCGKDTNHINGVCSDCATAKRKKALSDWEAQTTDEKLSDLHRRLLAIETRLTTF